MKVKFGSEIVDGRGKIGGHVFAKNRSGNYKRVKVTPVNPQTSFQQDVRNRLSTYSSNWAGLTEAQRDAFDGAVDRFAKTDIFGDLRNPTGKNLYTRLNINLDEIGGTAITAPPATLPVVEGKITAVNAAAGLGTLTIDFENENANMTYIVSATPQISPGKNYVKNLYRDIAVVTSAAIDGYNLAAEYTARFGALVEGQKMFVKVTAVRTTTGLKGVGSQASAIVAA